MSKRAKNNDLASFNKRVYALLSLEYLLTTSLSLAKLCLTMLNCSSRGTHSENIQFIHGPTPGVPIAEVRSAPMPFSFLFF